MKSPVMSYVAGFVLSIILTLTAYSLVVNQIFSGWGLVYAITGLALVQLMVQLLFFLHLGREEEPRWNLLVFDLTLVIVIIVVAGSLWIMNNLHYNMSDMGSDKTSPQEIERQLLREEGIRR